MCDQRRIRRNYSIIDDHGRFGRVLDDDDARHDRATAMGRKRRRRKVL